jgi:hypothetical protein
MSDSTEPTTGGQEGSSPGRNGRGRDGHNSGRGRGRGNRNRSGRGNGGGGNAPPTFLRSKDGMKGNIFQCHGENANKQQLNSWRAWRTHKQDIRMQEF